ncbi:MAG: hypothetical protein AMJ53_06230 [Gammaproteobacteria bacterium SG8_11]|nr:MAG: hypothetical protein AMJ53_06230 [Gammaproteobacteria bacterium SG8_11]
MEVEKSNCDRCGVSILDSTKEKTGGYCIRCKQLTDLEAHIRKKRQIAKTKQESTRRKYGKHVGHAIRLGALALMVFGSSLQLYGHFPKIQGSGSAAFISLLIVVVSSIAIVFFFSIFVLCLGLRKIYQKRYTKRYK